MTSLARLYDQHALASYDKQYRLAEVVGDRPWNADFRFGRIAFGNDIEFAFQVIGSQSDYDNTWMWAWANSESGLPDELTRASDALRAIGRRLNVPELQTPKFDLGSINGHYIAMVASGLCGASCYYRAPYPEGAAFLLIPEARAVEEMADFSAHYIVNRVMDFIVKAEIDHKAAVEAYLTFKGYGFEYQDQLLKASLPSGENLTAEFDDTGRIKRIEAVITPPLRL